jgi:alpha 1,2-mannosyltransferase
MLIRKSTRGISKALFQTLYMQQHSSIFFKLLLGDKDTFRFGFRAVNQPFHMVNVNVRPVGSDGDKFRGHSMVQSLPNGTAIFCHANLLKYRQKSEFKGERVRLVVDG